MLFSYYFHSFPPTIFDVLPKFCAKLVSFWLCRYFFHDLLHNYLNLCPLFLYLLISSIISCSKYISAIISFNFATSYLYYFSHLQRFLPPVIASRQYRLHYTVTVKGLNSRSNYSLVPLLAFEEFLPFVSLF